MIMPYLICYDISSDSLRTRIAKKIITTGLDRVNKSVYMGQLTDNALQQLEKNLDDLIRKKGEPEDSLIVLPVLPHQIQAMRIYGDNGLDKKELSGEKSTHII
jgi:CRISPR-associated endonuclease Cas2